MTYEPPVEGTPEEERPALQPGFEDADETAVAPEQTFAEADDWEDDFPATEAPVEQPAAAEPAAYYLSGDGRQGGPPVPPEPPPARGRNLPSTIAVILLAVALLGVTAFGLKLYRDRQTATTAASELLGVISEGAPAGLVSQLSSIQADLASGKVAEASGQIASLKALIAQHKTPEGESGPTEGGPLPEQAYKDLSPDAALFFKANEDLFRRFLMMCDRAREMRDAGENVEALRKIRDEILEAARLGQKETVQKKMLQMLRLLGGKLGQGGPGAREGAGRGQLAAKAERLRKQAARAQQQGKDLRAVFLLMQKAEQAAGAGKFDEAGKYLDEALVAVKRAPRAGAADRRRMPLGGRRGGPGVGQNPLAPFVRALLGVMAAEETNLRVIADNLLSAKGVLFGPKPPAEQPDLLKPLLDNAMKQMTVVADRRKELQARVEGAKRPNGKPLLPANRPGRDRLRFNQGAPEDRKGMLEIVRERVGGVLDAVRTLKDEDYQRDRKRLIGLILQAVFDPPTPAEQARLQGRQPAPETPSEREDALRAKMLQASPVLRQWELAGKDTEKAEALFAQARKDLYAKKLDEAEKAVEEAMVILGLTPPPATGGDAVPPLKIDLRAKP